MAEQSTSIVFDSIRERMEEAKSSALFELKDLKSDLVNLERILAGRKKDMDLSLLDVVNSAFELYRHSQTYFENKKLLEGVEEDLADALARESLLRNGAQLLKKPAGWHWISPKGEMIMLGETEETLKAAKKLEGILKRMKSRKAKAKPDPATEEPEAESKEAEADKDQK